MLKENYLQLQLDTKGNKLVETLEVDIIKQE